MIHREGKKSDFRIKKLKLYYKGDIATIMKVASRLESLNCLLLNCQSARSLQRRHNIEISFDLGCKFCLPY